MNDEAVSRFHIGHVLLQSRATPLRAVPVGREGVWLVQWRNADTEVEYRQPGHHTLSLYLEGGEAIRCHEAPGAQGAPGSLCCMPAEHESHWSVDGSVHMLHVYMPTLPLASAAERWLDLDPRVASLRERIYFRDPMLAELGRRIAQLPWHDEVRALQLEHLVMQLQARLLLAHAGPGRRIGALRGGLSPQARRRVLERIEAAFAGPQAAPLPDLRELADVACLSEFHFARMFKASFGTSPHAWVMQRRLSHARELLAQGRCSLQQVVERAGYAHLSHLNAALRGAGLASAARYRESLRSGQRPVAASCGA
jgi:AraC family transcriptional regulator